MAQNKRQSSSWSPLQAFRNLLGGNAPPQPPEDNNRARYLTDLIYQHRNFDVKGIAAPGEATLLLPHVFVDVGLGKGRGTAPTNPIPPLQKQTEEQRFSIWRFLNGHATKHPQNLVVLGAPGTGKTTLLKHLALSLADSPKKTAQKVKTPILLYLRDYAEEISKNPNFKLLQAVQLLLTNRKVEIALDWLQDALANGRCLVMLDGLDEVANLEQRQQVAAWVQRQIHQHLRNQFIITSRPFGYESNPLPDTLLLEVKPFTIEQVRHFVDNWYFATEVQSQGRDDAGVRQDAAQRAADLMQRLHQTPALLEMGINPLLLTMITTIHHYRSSLPDQRVALYNEICDVFLGKRHQARGISYELTPAQKKRVLQSLAFEMMRRNLRNIVYADAADIIDPALKRVQPDASSSSFLKMIINTSGLLVEHAPEVYSFAHLTFQEYLTAVHIKDQQLERMLIQRVDDTWWHETIRLYAAQTNASNIVRACVMRETASIPALTLAVECLDEALEVDDDFRKIPAQLIHSIEDDNPEIRRIGAEVLLQLRLRRLVRLDETVYADSSLVTQAEYQLFLDEMRAQGSYRQPDHWSEWQFAKGMGQKPVAGVRPSDARAFCNWLSERNPGPWQFRLPTDQEVNRPPLDQASTEPNQSNIGYWFVKKDQPGLVPAPDLAQDVALVQTLRWQLEQKLLNDLIAFKELGENDPAAKQLQQIILTRAQNRAFSLLDLERKLPINENNGEEIGRFFNLIQDRNTEGFATDMEQALITAKAYVDNPNFAYVRAPILEEIFTMGNRLLVSLQDLPFSPTATEIMRQLMRDLGRAREQLHVAQKSMQSEFVSHRELVRHINNALYAAQQLLEEINNNRTDARIRLRFNLLLRCLNFLQRHSAGKNEENGNSRRKKIQLLQVFIDLYVDIAILENRDGQKAEALEGIRIVRETTP